MPRVLRDRVRVSYDELIEDPSFDEYIFCASCGDYVYEYCAIHGPPLVIPDDEVPSPTGFPPFVPRAALTIPRRFLHLAPSTIPGAGLGVFSTLTLPRDVRFGPYRGMKTDKASSPYCWQIFDRSHKPAHVLDARDANKSNWMRYVNCSRHSSEQNLIAYQYYGQLYYRTIRIIPRFTELLVFYGSESSCELNLDVRRYNAPAYTEILVKCEADKEEIEKVCVKLKIDTSTLDVKENVFQNPEMRENTPELHFESEAEHSLKKESLKVNLKNIQQECNSKGYENMVQGVNYVCDVCGQAFNEKYHLITHISTHKIAKDVKVNINTSTVQKHACSTCGCKCSSKSDLINHLVKIHNSNIKYSACTQCDYKTEHRGLKEHMERHSGVCKYKCDICAYAGATKNYLQKHKKCHLADKQYLCITCGSKFINEKSLRTHSMIHTGDRPFTCTICGKAFTVNKYLKRHMVIHTTREKRYTCQTCNKRFYTRFHLNKHTKLHL